MVGLSRDPVERLAQIAIAYTAAIAVYFPSAALDMAEAASEVLLSRGVRWWLSPMCDAITCTKCRLTSRHPKDVAEHFCGNCGEFLDDLPLTHSGRSFL